MKWINVQDKLPKKVAAVNEADKWVLCSTASNACLLSLCYYDHNSKKWFDGFNSSPETRITHWMPLPNAPIKDEIKERQAEK